MKFSRRATATLGALVAGAVILLGASQASAQATGAIQGLVVEAQSQRPLASAQVFVAGTGIGTITNNEGRFLLVNVPAGTHTVRIQLIGYAAQDQQVTVTAGATATVNFELGLSAIALDEVVVTGQGRATERRRLATNVDVINERAISLAPVNSVDQLLQGRVPGGTVNAMSAQPGTGALINFRGVSSVYGSQTPVIYVDGVRVDTDMSTAGGTGGEQSSALADLLVTDIERIEVTKGGAASTLYGSDAATGVIQIFTKKGSPGEPRITFRVDQGFDTPELKYMTDTGPIFADQFAGEPYPETLLQDRYFQTGHAQSYYAGVSGGTADFTYNVSGRISENTGVQPKNESTLFTMRGGVQASVTDDLRLDFSGSYTRHNFGRLFNGTAIADPLTTFEVGDAIWFSGAQTLDEALDIFLMPEIDEQVSRMIFASGLSYTPSDLYSARLTVGVDYRGNQQRELEPIGFTPGEYTGELDRYQREFNSVSLDFANTISYPRSGNITSDFTFGAQGFRDDESIVSAQGTTFALPGAPDFDEAAVIDASESNSELFNGGLYFDEKLGLFNRVFVNGGMRLDFNTTFGEEVDFQLYPKIGASYMVSDEPMVRDLVGTLVDDLKLRVAYGQTGKFPEPFLRDRSFEATSFRGESAPRFDNPGNTDLGPEVTSTVEMGFDLAVLSNRVGLGFTWYDATTKDALFFVPEPPATGLGTQLRNVGEIANTGIELALNFQVVSTPTILWSLGATYNAVDNRIVDMGGASPFWVGGTYQRICGPPNDCDPDTEGIEEMPVGAWYVDTPIDTNGDGLLDDTAPMFIMDGDHYASPVPRSSGSFNTDVTLFNRLTVSALADWARGFMVMDWGSIWATFNRIYRREILEDGYDFPIQYTTGGTEIGEYFSYDAVSEFILDGDYLKLREISAHYAVPVEFTDRFGIDGVTVFGSVRNVAIWSATPMIDPELNGLDSGADLVLGGESSITLSPPRQFRLGVEINF